MIPERRKLITRFIPFLLIGLLVIICYLYYFVDTQEMITLLRSVNPLYYSLATIAMLSDTLFFSLTWQYFLKPLSIKAPFRKTFLFVWASIFVDILVPAESVSADISKAYLMSRETGETERNTGKIAASLISHRILGTVVALGSLLGSCFSFYILRYEIPEEPVLGMTISNWIALVTLGTSITIFFLFALALKREITQKIMDSVFKLAVFISRGRWQPTKLRSKVQNGLNAFHYAMKVLGGHPSSLAGPMIFALMSWLSSLLISFLVFFSLGHPVHFGIVVIVHSLTCAIQSIPLGVPAEVGLTEVVMISLYTAFLRETPDVGALSAAATLLIRILTVGLRFFIGFVAIQWVGAKALMDSSRQRPPQGGEDEEKNKV